MEFNCPAEFDTCVMVDFKANGPPVGPHGMKTIRSCGLKTDREGMRMAADECLSGEQEVCKRLISLAKIKYPTLRSNLTAAKTSDLLQRVDGTPRLDIRGIVMQ